MRRRTMIALAVPAILAALAFPLNAQTERRPMRIMAGDALDLTPEQEARLDEMAKAHQAARKDLFDRMEKLRGELDDLVEAPDYDPGKADGLIDEMARLRAEQQKAGLRHRIEFRKVLTPEQLKKLDDYRESFGRSRRAGFRPPFGRGAGRLGGPAMRGFRLRHARWRW